MNEIYARALQHVGHAATCYTMSLTLLTPCCDCRQTPAARAKISSKHVLHAWRLHAGAKGGTLAADNGLDLVRDSRVVFGGVTAGWPAAVGVAAAGLLPHARLRREPPDVLSLPAAPLHLQQQHARVAYQAVLPDVRLQADHILDCTQGPCLTYRIATESPTNKGALIAYNPCKLG